MSRRLDGCAAEQSRIKTLVRVRCPRVLPASALAWRGNRDPTRRSGRIHVSGSRHVVRLASWSEAETARANEQLVVRGEDLLCETETCRARQRLVGGGSISRELVEEAPS
jgi:hypothetical protein